MAPVAVAPPPLRFSFQPLAGHKVRRGCGAQSPARKKRRIGCGAQSPARKKARIDKGVLTRLPKGGPRPSGPRAIVQRESGADHDTQPVSPAARVGPIPTLTMGPRSFMFWLSPSPSPSPSQPPPRASVPDAVMRPGEALSRSHETPSLWRAWPVSVEPARCRPGLVFEGKPFRDSVALAQTDLLGWLGDCRRLKPRPKP